MVASRKPGPDCYFNQNLRQMAELELASTVTSSARQRQTQTQTQTQRQTQIQMAKLGQASTVMASARNLWRMIQPS